MRCLLLAGLLAIQPAFGWGEEGHRIAARIAAALITDASVSARILAALGGETNGTCTQTDLADRLACVSTWADDVKRTTRRDTRNWHFVDIPMAADSYDAGRDCRERSGGDCIMNAIIRERNVLAQPAEGITALRKAEAVKFLVHLVADLHMPLHAIDDHDRGGNGKLATWFGEATTPYGHWNVHAVWDDGLLYRSETPKAEMRESASPADVAYARLLLKSLDAGPRAPYSEELLAAWAIESHDVAVKQAYGTLPATRQGKADGPESTDEAYYALGAEYLESNAGAAETQLKRAGQRLADVLNEIFSPAP